MPQLLFLAANGLLYALVFVLGGLYHNFEAGYEVVERTHRLGVAYLVVMTNVEDCAQLFLVD